MFEFYFHLAAIFLVTASYLVLVLLAETFQQVSVSVPYFLDDQVALDRPGPDFLDDQIRFQFHIFPGFSSIFSLIVVHQVHHYKIIATQLSNITYKIGYQSNCENYDLDSLNDYS